MTSQVRSLLRLCVNRFTKTELSASRKSRKRVKPKLTCLETRCNPSGGQQFGAIGDFVFFDQNLDGIQDVGEFGVPNQTVNLRTSAGGLINTTTTDSFGGYLFDGLPEGKYIVEFVTSPAGWFFSPANQGPDDVDSDVTVVSGQTGRTDVINLQPGQRNKKVDAGLTKPVHAIVGNFVWNDLNCDGIQQQGEPGLPNVSVKVLNAAGAVIQTATTDANGMYMVTGLIPGSYQVMYVLPAGFVFSPGNVGSDDTVDSDANPANGMTPTVVLQAGQADLTIDAGLCVEKKPSSIRGKVYYDANDDGIPQGNEPGIAGAKIILTGTESMGGASVMRMMFTGPDGTYLFTGLMPGTYKVTEIQPPNFLDGKDRTGSAGGITTNDMTDQIPIAAMRDEFNYDFGEKLDLIGKEGLLASGGQLKLAKQAGAMPLSPTYGNSVAASRLADPSFRRFVVTAGDFGTAPLVRVFDFGTGVDRFSFHAYNAGFRGGVRVAVGDVTGDAIPDIVTAAGPNGGPHIRVFSGLDGSMVSEFYAYAASFTAGVYVTVGDVNNDGVGEIITGAGEGGGPHVKVFNLGGGVVREFFAYAGGFTGGVRIASGDVNGDGRDDIVTGAGPGGGPHVRVFSGNAAQGVLSEAFAYSAGFLGGIYVGTGDVNGDGRAEVITGPGAGPAQPVRIFNGLNFSQISSFFGYTSNFTGGARVAALDIDGDGRDEVLTTPGAGLPAFTRAFNVTFGHDMEDFMAMDPTILNGAFVGGGR